MLRYLSSPFKWFFKLEAASGLVLLFSAIIALIISNSNYAELYFQTLNQLNKSLSLESLSMGMSADYIDAIKHESNFVRVGSSIFGSRSKL